MEILGIDVGGSGIKAAIVNTETAELVSERHRIDTPQPPNPRNIAKVIKKLVKKFDYEGTVGCSFPTVIINGKATTSGNIDEEWVGTQVDELFQEKTGLPFIVHNDADLAGMAEMEMGAGKGLEGMVIMVTIGTGLGTGVFYNGVLVPNIELGRIFGKDGQPIEFYAGDRARKVNKLGWEEWGERFNFFLNHVNRVFSPNHFILGGGASHKLDRYQAQLDVKVPIRVAQFRNNAGIIGAALAVERKLREEG